MKGKEEGKTMGERRGDKGEGKREIKGLLLVHPYTTPFTIS